MTSIRTRLGRVLAVAATAAAIVVAAPTIGATFSEVAPIVTHAPIAGIAVPAPMAACTEEDGSGPGQAFPCAWTASIQGNGIGESYVLFVAA